ncbi:MAG: zinc ribbon domain-containing protein [Eubacteriales bacterium]|nr:zinc ribbon domain-containing protein [Eubacteriales bacterium]
MFCIRCGTQLHEDAKFCSKCGFAVTQEKKNRYCMICGAEMQENQMFCTACGTLFDEQRGGRNDSQPVEEDIASNDTEGIVNKSYENLHYAVETKKPKTMKMCNILMKEEQMEIKRHSSHAVVRAIGRQGGMIGGAIAGGMIALMDAKNADKPTEIVIPYKNIANLEKGMYINNPTIIITLQNGSIYTIAVKKFQEEIWTLLESKTRVC